MEATISSVLAPLVGLHLFKSWNALGTRYFYFGKPGLSVDDERQDDYWLQLECPWRIRRSERILTGIEDYGDEPDLQMARLEELFGASNKATLLNPRGDLIVSRVDGDAWGGFEIEFANGAVLEAFPTTSSDIEWLMSPQQGRLASWNMGQLEIGSERAR